MMWRIPRAGGPTVSRFLRKGFANGGRSLGDGVGAIDGHFVRAEVGADDLLVLA